MILNFAMDLSPAWMDIQAKLFAVCHAHQENKWIHFNFEEGSLGRMRTPVRDPFSYGIRHWIPYASLNHNKYAVRIPHENASHTGVRILPNVSIHSGPSLPTINSSS